MATVVVYLNRPDEPPVAPPLLVPSAVRPQPTTETELHPLVLPEQDSELDFEQPEETSAAAPPMALREIQKPIVREVERQTPGPVRTYDQDDPAVKAALRRVPIEVYAAAHDEDAARVSQFLRENGLEFRRHDWSEPMAQERARRLSGSSDGLTLVVDGQVLQGFSKETLQQALAVAVKRRVTAAALPDDDRSAAEDQRAP